MGEAVVDVSRESCEGVSGPVEGSMVGDDVTRSGVGLEAMEDGSVGGERSWLAGAGDVGY